MERGLSADPTESDRWRSASRRTWLFAMCRTTGNSSTTSGSVMSGRSSSGAEWFSKLTPAPQPEPVAHHPDDPRLSDVIEVWRGDLAALRPGRAVLIGFPQDEGVRRNHGRPGAAEGPRAIRQWLYRLTTWDALSKSDLTSCPLLDAGNVR